MNKEIKCPHCGDTWKYKYAIDYETGKAVVTQDFIILEDSEKCTCFKCGNQYTPKVEHTDVKMLEFVYKAWRRVKGK